MIYYPILYYTTLYYPILYYTIYYTILYYTILYYTTLHYTILYYTILYYAILHYTILWCTVTTSQYSTLFYILYQTCETVAESRLKNAEMYNSITLLHGLPLNERFKRSHQFGIGTEKNKRLLREGSGKPIW
jgi:hypothetical protein